MFQRCTKVCWSYNSGHHRKVYVRHGSALSKAEARKKRNEIFDDIKKRERAAVGRIEKIEVKYESSTDDVTLIMNKHLSTPFHCAKHLSEGVSKVSALALVDGQLWDMHRPLSSSCTLKFLNLMSPQSSAVNKAFWRTCSFMMGAIIDEVFKDDITVHLHSFPAPIVQSGSFVYNVYLDLAEWKPSISEYRALAAVFIQRANKELPIERIETTEDIASDMFQDNPFKSEQIPGIAMSNDGKVTLYRMGEHVDISKGPMLANSNFVGRCAITAVHKLDSPDFPKNIYRVQGVAIPRGIALNQFAFGILQERARKLNDTFVMRPQRLADHFEEGMPLSAKN